MGLNMKWKGQIYLKTKMMAVLPLRKGRNEIMGLFYTCVCYAALGMAIIALANRSHSRWLQAFGICMLCIAIIPLIGVTVSMVLPKDGTYEAVRDGEIVTYSKCYKEHGHNVCEMPLLKNKVFVDDFWKK